MKLKLEETKQGDWAFHIFDDRSEPNVMENSVFMLPEHKARVEEIIDELRHL